MDIKLKTDLVNILNEIIGDKEFNGNIGFVRNNGDIYVKYGNYYIYKCDSKFHNIRNIIREMITNYCSENEEFVIKWEESIIHIFTELYEPYDEIDDVLTYSLYQILKNDIDLPVIDTNDIITSSNYKKFIDKGRCIFCTLVNNNGIYESMLVEYDAISGQLRNLDTDSKYINKVCDISLLDIKSIYLMDQIDKKISNYFSNLKIIPHPSHVKNEVIDDLYMQLSFMDSSQQTIDSKIMLYCINKALLNRYVYGMNDSIDESVQEYYNSERDLYNSTSYTRFDIDKTKDIFPTH